MEKVLISVFGDTAGIVLVLIMVIIIALPSHVLASYIANRVAKKESSKMQTYFFLVILLMFWFSAIFSAYTKTN